MGWAARLAVALGLLLAAAACGPTPTEPTVAGNAIHRTGLVVSGTWTGPLQVRLPEGDWSAAEVVLVQAGEQVSGKIISRDGVSFTLSGSSSRDGVTLAIQGLPGTSTCAGVSLFFTAIVRDAGVDHLLGRASGRCFGTLSATLDLTRAGRG